jgi:tetratricopeptide (TPR) repeat protein
MPALGIVEELAGELGVVLWRCARDVALWAGTPPARRGALFAGAAAERRSAHLRALPEDAELAGPLSVMVRLLETPAALPEPVLLNACRRVSLWAEQRGHLATALEFMQAGALVAPESAALAYGVGRLARRRAEYDRAESWYARAIVQARRAEDHATYARAYGGLGTLAWQRGNLPAARRAFLRCLKSAVRHGETAVEGTAYHDLFMVELETGAGLEAEVLAKKALVAYGSNTEAVARLAFDVAYEWILRGRFAEALQVAQAIDAHFEGPCDRALVLSMIARSAAGVGRSLQFDESARRLDEMLANGTAEEAAAGALLGLAYGAVSLHKWDLAQRFAERALAAATIRREGKLMIAADAALDQIRRHLVPEECGTTTGRQSELANHFVAALKVADVSTVTL